MLSFFPLFLYYSSFSQNLPVCYLPSAAMVWLFRFDQHLWIASSSLSLTSNLFWNAEWKALTKSVLFFGCFGVRWDSTMGKCQEHRIDVIEPGRCHDGGPGSSCLTEGYHLLYFCCIKSPGDMLRRSGTVRCYCTHCFLNRYTSVVRMQTSNVV